MGSDHPVPWHPRHGLEVHAEFRRGGPGGSPRRTAPAWVSSPDDPWFQFVYDTRWRITATYRASHYSSWTIDGDPKEQFVYQNAGLGGSGGSSYIDSVILRDRDANTAWEDEADPTLEERTYYCQNWRADVVALMTSDGHLINQVRYDPYGVPFGIAKSDLEADGDVDTNDYTQYSTYYSGSTMPFADWNWDGTKNTSDITAYLNDKNADSGLGRGVLAYMTWSHAGGATGTIHRTVFDDLGRVIENWIGTNDADEGGADDMVKTEVREYDTNADGGNNRKGYAGYEIDPILGGSETWQSIYHVRNRVYLSQLGRWTRRDPLGYVDGYNLNGYVGGAVVCLIDPSALAGQRAVGDSGGEMCEGRVLMSRGDEGDCQDGDGGGGGHGSDVGDTDTITGTCKLVIHCRDSMRGHCYLWGDCDRFGEIGCRGGASGRMGDLGNCGSSCTASRGCAVGHCTSFGPLFEDYPHKGSDWVTSLGTYPDTVLQCLANAMTRLSTCCLNYGIGGPNSNTILHEALSECVGYEGPPNSGTFGSPGWNDTSFTKCVF